MKVSVVGDGFDRREEIKKYIDNVDEAWIYYNDMGIKDKEDATIVLDYIRELVDIICELIESNQILEEDVTMWKGEAQSPR